ncbi:MAG: molybdopterin molybdotransferase MoeA [Thermoplasmata archaeon]
MRMRPFGTLLSHEEALGRLLRATRPASGSEMKRLGEALGRVPTAPVRSRVDVPPFARATWDGYALRARDSRDASPSTPRRLALAGEVFAETPRLGPLRPGEAAAIATGGALPTGADSVVPFEEVRLDGGGIELTRPCRPGDRIAGVGEDFARGRVLAGPDEPLTPASLGALAAAGIPSVRVHRLPRVAIVANGNELLAPGGSLGPGQIFESNSEALAAFVRAAGSEPIVLPSIPDDPVRIRRGLAAAGRRADLVLAAGGSSVGEHDHLPAIFPKLGRLLFHGLAVRPGKPTLAAVGMRTLFVGLPGHPTSCLANAYWLLLPVLRKMAHLPGPGTYDRPARLAEPYPIGPGPFATVVPLRVEGPLAHPTFRDSSAITSLVPANGFVIVPAGHRSLPRGASLTVRMLPPPFATGPQSPPASGPRAPRSKVVSTPRI